MKKTVSLNFKSELPDHLNWIGFRACVAEALKAAACQIRKDPSEAIAFDLACAEWIEKQQMIIKEGHHPLFYALILLSGFPILRDKLRARAVDDEVIRATVQDIGIWIEEYYSHYGQWGFDKYQWSQVCFSGRLFALGRLQFEMTTFPATCELPNGFSTKTPILNVHIPVKGKLSNEACEKSFAWARDFFPKHFPEYSAAAFVCESWLMDRQLGEYLPNSNIAQFQRRFHSLDRNVASDEQIWERVFGGRIDLKIAPCDTALRRIVIEHIGRGGRWATGVGYFPTAK